MGEPRKPHAMGFFDGQNLYQHAKDAFGHHHPNFDPLKLHAAVCAARGWQPNAIKFYTGIPSVQESEMWSGYWSVSYTHLRAHETGRNLVCRLLLEKKKKQKKKKNKKV